MSACVAVPNLRDVAEQHELVIALYSAQHCIKDAVDACTQVRRCLPTRADLRQLVHAAAVRHDAASPC